MLTKTIDLAKFFYVQRVTGFDPPDDEPYMDPEGSERFKQELAKATRYLEFGSGGTTILADRAGIPTISVESDRFYARAVASRLSGDNVRQVVVDLGVTGPWGAPLYNNPDKGWRYTTAPFWGQTCHSPDFILVDGRYRVACALTAAMLAHERNAPATLMFDDYAPRPWYHVVEKWLGKPEMAGRTAVFQIGSQAVEEPAVRFFHRDMG